MPRRIFKAAQFNGGMMLNADPSDLSEGFGVVALNTMASLDGGSIGGRYADGAPDGPANVMDYTYITKDGVTPAVGAVPEGSPYDLIYVTEDNRSINHNIYSMPDFGVPIKCVTGHRNYALIGVGKQYPAKYIGYAKGQDSLVITDNNFDTSNAKWKVIGSINPSGGNVPNTPSGVFNANDTYYWAFSVVYDGYMHSQLVPFFNRKGMTGSVEDHTASYMDRMMVSAHCDLDDNAWKRVTSLVIYRAVVSEGLTLDERSEFQRVHEFTGDDLTAMRGKITSSGDYSTWPLKYAMWVDNNTVIMGSSFANDSGLDEAVQYTNLGYDIAYEMNNFLFVGNVGWMVNGKQDLESGARMLFRSLRGKFCQFKIIDDYLALPFLPIALTSYNNRLIVFGAAEFAVINPETMVIENVVNGYGLESKFNVITTPHGVFFANKNNMYVFDGQQVFPIGNPMLRCIDDRVETILSDLGIKTYEDVVAQAAPNKGIQRVVYAPKVNSVMFLYVLDGVTGTVYAYVFSLDTKTWSVATFASSTAKSVYVDRANVLHIGNIPVMESLERVKDWKFVTKRYDFGNASQWKKIYSITLDATNTWGHFSASFDGGEWNGFNASPEGGIDKDHRRAHNVMIKFDPNEMWATYLNGIEITYREMLNTK